MGIGDLIPTDIALRAEEPPADPRYTIPPSSIVYATALTSLVGRIPVNGRLETPWRFKLISSGRNLTSRRFEVPGLEGVIWTGIAHGDYTLVVCIRNHRHDFVCLRRWLGSHPAFACRSGRHYKRNRLDLGRARQSLHQRRPEDECSASHSTKRSRRHLLRPGTGLCGRAVHPQHRFQRYQIDDCDGRCGGIRTGICSVRSHQRIQSVAAAASRASLSMRFMFRPAGKW